METGDSYIYDQELTVLAAAAVSVREQKGGAWLLPRSWNSSCSPAVLLDCLSSRPAGA
jgi:hypothetical protein